MKIEDMFEKDIKRTIGGVVKVEQDDDKVIEQEVTEYVITSELKIHFSKFFSKYSESFTTPTSDTGVWIQGFFGSGKSHFLKMLSYILENKIINGVSTVERFREKFDDPATFMQIDASTHGKTQTILFNIDIESAKRDELAVLRVFAKMFYNKCGYYGDNLKVVQLEKYLDQVGKLAQFREVYNQKSKIDWDKARKALQFNGKFVIPSLMEVLDMSEEEAKKWFSDREEIDISVENFVSDVKEYVEKQGKNYRLIFMVDEMGQYAGSDKNKLLNLQSIVEALGSQCNGQVWVMCTGQEALDEIIKVRTDEFARIQDRFKTRLSLSSSSVDEVIQKRLLKKNESAQNELTAEYEKMAPTLKNLFSFSNTRSDIKGFSNGEQFANVYPFVPYQFMLMPEVYAEIRKHGNAAQHLASGERSMLSGFQESAIKYKDKDNTALVPFYEFYDTIHSSLGLAIRSVIERAEKAANDKNGLERQDVSLLKLLYLIRYLDKNIPSNVENLIIMMADNIEIDKVNLRKQVEASLERLLKENYISQTGETYNFLTDEEQDIQREINNTAVDMPRIQSYIGNLLFGDIYPTKKYRYNIYDFDYQQVVDGTIVGSSQSSIKLRFLTVVSDDAEKNDMTMLTESTTSVIINLGDTPYFELIEKAQKIRKYVNQHNVSQLSPSMQQIIQLQQTEANSYEVKAKTELINAINTAEFFAGGEKLQVTGSDVKTKIDQAMKYLIESVYTSLNCISKNVDSDADIINILAGSLGQGIIPGMETAEANYDACTKVHEYLEIQKQKNLPTTMNDIQSKYQGIPYGWREIDIAGVVAQLIYHDKVTIKVGGNQIQANNMKLPDMLRRKSETSKTQISIKQAISQQIITSVTNLMRDYFGTMSVAQSEAALVQKVIESFTAKRDYLNSIKDKYSTRKYPGYKEVCDASKLVDDVLSQQKDSTSLLTKIQSSANDLLDSKERMTKVESFFKNQITVFDEACALEDNLKNDCSYFEEDSSLKLAYENLCGITMVPDGQPYNYKRIPELNTLIATIKDEHSKLLVAKRKTLCDVIDQCIQEVKNAAGTDSKASSILMSAESYFSGTKSRVNTCLSLALLDGQSTQIVTYKDGVCSQIEKALAPEPAAPTGTTSASTPAPASNAKSFMRSVVFPSKKLSSETEVDAYLADMKQKLMDLINQNGTIQLN